MSGGPDLLALAAPVVRTEGDRVFARLVADGFADRVARSPGLATFLGIHDHDGRYGDLSRGALLDAVAAERRLLAALSGTGPRTATAVDVSLPLVQVAVDRLAGAAGTALGRPVVCDLGLAAADLPAMVGEAPGARVVTLYGILPGMEAFAAMGSALSLLRPGDLLAVSANLLPPGEDELDEVVAQYDNEPTRRWLGALLEDAGIEPGAATVRIGPLSDPGTGACAAVGAWLEPVEAIDLELDGGEVRLEPGSPVRLLRSARHTPAGLEAIVEAAGLDLLALEVSPSGEEGVALAVAPG